MPKSIVIHEYGYLFAGEGGQLSTSAFSYLRACAITQPRQSQFLALTSRHGHECLQVKNYVGVLSTPDGTVIEILPKHSSYEEDIVDSRRLLWKMLRVVHDMPWQSSTDADLQTYRKPLPELLIGKFLSAVSHLVHRGVRSDYQRLSDTKRYLKGRLNVARQLRMPPSRATDFCIEFDQYSINRPENRLIKLTLERVSRWHLGVTNTRVAKELAIAFSNVDTSKDITGDFIHWRKQRDMAHYQPVRPWLELILRNQSPWSFSGGWQGISMLFPMEQLFESYVERILRRQLAPGFSLIGQASSKYLTHHQGRGMFQLRPDILVRRGPTNYSVMDTKWKLLDQSASDSFSKYNLKQSDMYQLFAYGHKYLDGAGDLVLIFPMHRNFQAPLEPFYFSENLRLWSLPYDLDIDSLILPPELELSCFRSLLLDTA